MGFQFFIPTKLLFGQGTLNKLAKQKMPGKKGLIVISSGKSVRVSGTLDKVVEQIKTAGAESVIFDGISPNPSLENVRAGTELGRKEGCDFVVGLGGGSSIDAAKAIAMMLTNEGDYWEYQYGKTGGRKKAKAAPAPLIAIPTTAGTGTETDPWMVITNEETNEKIGGGGPKSFPVLSIVDPELMATIPPHLTAYQGFDALFHGIECYLAKVATPMSDIYSLKTVEAVGRNLAAAVADGSNMDAREQVAFGSTLAGFAMSFSSNGSEHAMEHALSAYHTSLPHGAGLIMISKEYHTMVASTVPELADRYVDLAKAMGMEDAKEPMDFVKALVKLQEVCGVAELKMSDYGMKIEECPAFADNAKETMGVLFATDRFQLSREQVIEIYEKSFR